MSIFTLTISCLTTSSLPWFMELTFEVPMQYCSLQRRTLLLSSVTSTAGHCFCFGSVSSFFLELFLHWSPVAYWAPVDLGSSSLSVLSFCLSYCSLGSQGKNTQVACHSLSSGPCFVRTLHHDLSWVALHGTALHGMALHSMAYSFTELDKAVVHVIRLVSFLGRD